jgi:Putative MetA-pathway of phenol degradation
MCNRFRLSVIFILATALGTGAASAHHPGIGGIGGAGGIFTMGAGTLDQGQFAFAAFLDYVRLKQLSDATLLANIGNDVHGLQSIESRGFAISAGLTNDFMVSVRFPWVRRTGIREGVFVEAPPLAGAEGDLQEETPPLGTVHDRSTSGFGDMTALGQYRFLNSARTGTQAALLFGFKAPTGKTSAVDPFGELFEAEFQPGSGSWDGLFGAAFSQQLTPAWSFHANVLAVATGTGTQDTNLGNRFLYNAAIAYRLFGETTSTPHSHTPLNAYAHAGHSHGSVAHSHGPVSAKQNRAEASQPHVAMDAFLEVNGEWHDKQRTAGIVDPNSGGNTVYVSPGLRLTVEMNWSSYVLVGFPVVNDLNGIQATPSWRLIAGFSLVLGP